MDLSWHALNSVMQVKTLCHTEKQGFDYSWLSKKFQTHPLKPAESEPSFRKVNLLPVKLQKNSMVFHRDLQWASSWYEARTGQHCFHCSSPFVCKL